MLPKCFPPASVLSLPLSFPLHFIAGPVNRSMECLSCVVKSSVCSLPPPPPSFPPRLAPGQRRRVLNDRQTSEMLKFAGLNPELRRQFLEQVVGDDVLGGFNNDPAVKAFGIQIKTTMVEVEARLLKQPMLGYGAPQALDPGTEVRGRRGNGFDGMFSGGVRQVWKGVMGGGLRAYVGA